jgi:hypothetical protein
VRGDMKEYKVSGYQEGNKGFAEVICISDAWKVFKTLGIEVAASNCPKTHRRYSYASGGYEKEEGYITYFCHDLGEEVGYYTHPLHVVFVFGTPRKIGNIIS